MSRRLRRARFEQQVTLEEFDFAASPKLPAARIRDPAALHGGESVVLYGPVGVGKRARRPDLGETAARADLPGHPRPRRLRHARGHRYAGRRSLRADHRTRRPVATRSS
nr:ATP-binding protein [Amycolatopsis sp. SID8362]